MSQSNPLAEAYGIGQSMWLDYIQKSLLEGDLQTMIAEDKVMGLTSNPAIFEQAIAKTNEYDDAIQNIVSADASVSNLSLIHI